jgi:hypothetical protein
MDRQRWFVDQQIVWHLVLIRKGTLRSRMPIRCAAALKSQGPDEAREILSLKGGDRAAF